MAEIFLHLTSSSKYLSKKTADISISNWHLGAAEIINNLLVKACLCDDKWSYQHDPDIGHFIAAGVFGARTLAAAANFKFLQVCMPNGWLSPSSPLYVLCFGNLGIFISIQSPWARLAHILFSQMWKFCVSLSRKFVDFEPGRCCSLSYRVYMHTHICHIYFMLS